MHLSADSPVDAEPRSRMPDPVLTLSGVSKSFPGVRALNDVSLFASSPDA